MTSTLQKLSCVLTVAATLALTGAAHGDWSLINLGSLDGRVSHGVALNNAGQVTGYSTYSGGGDYDYHPFLWENGAMTDLGTINNTYLAQPEAINAAGQVTGWSKIRPYPSVHACTWDGGTIADLGTLGGTQTWGHGINSAGHVVGHQTSPECAFVWDGTTLRDLNSASNPNWALASAGDINDAGKIVGLGRLDGADRAFLYDAGVVTDLGTLGTGNSSEACAISNSGMVVGRAANGETYEDEYASNAVTHAFLWQDGVMADLGTLGGILSEAYDVNESGQVVGKANYIEGNYRNYHAFLWDNGVMLDLNDLLPAGSGWELREATGINDLGYIVGYGTIGGQERGFVLVPEPGTLSCLLGLAALVLTKGRRSAS